MEKLIILGAGGHGFVIADVASQLGYNVLLWDDNILENNQTYKIEQRRSEIPDNSKLIIGIGNNKTREIISKQYPQKNYFTLIHPQTIISKNIKIGFGSTVMPGVIINNGSKIGEHCIINTGSIIEHDCTIKNYVHISPNSTLCGNVRIGNGTWVGAGSTIIQGIKIGENVTIGAGTVVIENIPNNATVVGNPGKIIKII